MKIRANLAIGGGLTALVFLVGMGVRAVREFD